MTLSINLELGFNIPRPTDMLLQVEAAMIPEQRVTDHWIGLPPSEHFARVSAQDDVGERIWLRTEGDVAISYRAKVDVRRAVEDIAPLAALPPHKLPGETVPYLMSSRYCPADRFQPFVEAEFGELQGGARIAAIRDWITENFSYEPGTSDANTTALESFVERRGVCRDYAHVLITLARASAIPARYVGGYGPRVDPQDFHAVAEIFLADAGGAGGSWHMVDATGMATGAEIAKIGIGRDAADVSFLTSFGPATVTYKSILVSDG
jgi:transglutaminase-like putative cysteine protease